MKECMTCHEKFKSLKMDNDGLYSCYDCAKSKDDEKLREEYYLGWSGGLKR